MAPRSRTGCLTCRQRKLKCSEERPICAQCLKANRECIPSSGITFRHQQNPSMNGDPVARESLKSFYGYKETFNDQTVWVSVPRELTFVHTNNPYEDEDGVANGEDVDDSSLLHNSTTLDESRQAELSLSQALYPTYATHGLQALSAVASQDQYNYAPPPAPMSHQEIATRASQDNATTNAVSQNLDFILNPTGGGLASPNNIDPRLHTPTESQQAFSQGHSPIHVRTLSYSSTRPLNLHSQGTRPSVIHDRELAFFLRDFSERAGHWMDIFDLDCFFGAHVPVLAVRCPLLLYSCAALSAKSLARVNGRKPIMNGQTSQSGRSKLEQWPGLAMSMEDWVRKGRENYDLAVSLLRQSLAGASRPPTSALPIDVTPQSVSTVQGAPLPDTDSDELVAATAILCVYEFLDASGMEWSRHLDGAKSLFDVAKDGMVPLTLPPSPISVTKQVEQGSEADLINIKRPGQGRVAVFWNFARQDMLAAFINNTRTRLDTDDLLMWQIAGLQLTFDGRVQPSNPQHVNYDRDNAMQDDMICNALIWLMAKLVNFIANSEDTLDAMSPLGLDQAIIDDWNDLDGQLRVWYDGLPDSFRPPAIRHSEEGQGIDETWFPRSMCASTMQSYHFARIQLLHHKPPSMMKRQCQRSSPGVSVAARHAEYTTILRQTRAHAKEIVSIGLGRADEGARVHSVQPLWTAGLVLGVNVNDDGQSSAEAEMWRCTIVSLLRAIERDMGWAAEYRVQSLLELWGLPQDWNPESDFTFG